MRAWAIGTIIGMAISVAIGLPFKDALIGGYLTLLARVLLGERQ